MTKKEFDLIKEVINERLKLDDIGPAVRLVTLYNRRSMYDKFESFENEKALIND